MPALTEEPEPPPPAAPAVRPFDRAAHCQRIAGLGGVATLAKYGPAHYVAIGKAAARATIARHGLGYWRGLQTVKRWTPRRPDLAADLAA